MRDRGAKQRNGETAKGRNGEAASGAHRGARLRNSRLYSQSYWWISTHREQGRFAAEPRAQRSAAEIVFRIARSFFRGVAHRGPRLGSVSVQSAIIRANTIRLAKRLLPFRSLAPLWAPLAPSPFRPFAGSPPSSRIALDSPRSRQRFGTWQRRPTPTSLPDVLCNRTYRSIRASYRMKKAALAFLAVSLCQRR